MSQTPTVPALDLMQRYLAAAQRGDWSTVD